MKLFLRMIFAVWPNLCCPYTLTQDIAYIIIACDIYITYIHGEETTPLV